MERGHAGTGAAALHGHLRDRRAAGAAARPAAPAPAVAARLQGAVRRRAGRRGAADRRATTLGALWGCPLPLKKRLCVGARRGAAQRPGRSHLWPLCALGMPAVAAFSCVKWTESRTTSRVEGNWGRHDAARRLATVLAALARALGCPFRLRHDLLEGTRINPVPCNANQQTGLWLTVLGRKFVAHAAARSRSVLPAGLRELDLHGCAALDGGALGSLAGLRQLSALCLDQCALLRDVHLPALATLTALRRLSLAGCRGVGGGGGEGLQLGLPPVLGALAALPRLAELSLAGLEQLRDEGLAGLARATALIALHLDLCPNLRCGPCGSDACTKECMVDIGALVGLRLTPASGVGPAHHCLFGSIPA